MEQVLTAVPYPRTDDMTWGVICPVHPAYQGSGVPTDRDRHTAETFAAGLACSHPAHVDIMVYPYMLRVGQRVRDVNPDRRLADDTFGYGSIVGVEIEDASTGVPTYQVEWDTCTVDTHGPYDIAPL